MSNPPLTQLQGAHPSAGAKSSISPPIAFRVADAYWDAGSSAYRLLHEEFDAATRGGVLLDFERALTYGVPAVSNLSFSLELFLKILVAQHIGSYPRGHEIGKLFRHLPNDAQDRIRAGFAQSSREDHFPYLTGFTITTSHSNTPGGLELRVTASDEARPAPDDPATVPAVVEMANDLFTVWRYIYEHGARPGQLTANFFGLHHLVRAIRMDVSSHKGAFVIEGVSDVS